jgi:uncharacterized surface protein with fasciclin (FAS1) repeats
MGLRSEIRKKLNLDPDSGVKRSTVSRIRIRNTVILSIETVLLDPDLRLEY